MAESEKRRSPRRDCDFAVNIERAGDGERSRGRIYNVSRTGAYLELDRPVATGVELTVAADPEEPEPPFARARAVVRWTRRIEAPVVLNSQAAGLEFLTPLRGSPLRPPLRVIAGGLK